MTSGSESLQVAIPVQVAPGVAGGVVQVLGALVRFLGELDDDGGATSYQLVVENNEQYDWLEPLCGPNQRPIFRDGGTRQTPRGIPASRGAVRRWVKKALGPALPKLKRLRDRVSPREARWPEVPLSDGFLERLGCDVVHFPTQFFEVCALPSVYNPHDLQHLHYPQFFSPRELATRETVYRAACDFCHTVVVGSNWIKRDVVKQYRVDPSKVQIIPWAAPNLAYAPVTDAAIRQTRDRFALPEAFCLYPAVTWPHKNHLRLLDAIAKLRDERDLIVNLVCTGSKYPSHQPVVERRISELGLGGQIWFLGFVSEIELRSLYRMSRFLVLPTLFEADSCPVHEAWVEGTPVASSNATAMPDQVCDAGLMFDPYNISAIADALWQIWTNASLRDELRRRGTRRVGDFDWTRTAKAFRATYRRAAGRTLTDEDRDLLAWDWMRNPRRTETDSHVDSPAAHLEVSS